jgi:predicted site-specific integrase-resolvase
MVGIKEAARLLGVTPKTLRLWEKEGKYTSLRTDGGHRRYNLNDILGQVSEDEKLTVCYARVSTHEQKDDLKRQEQILELHCAANGYRYEIISDLGSGLNYTKKGIKTLIKKICSNQIKRLDITHKDRLLRFGSELIFSLCENFGVEVVVLNNSDNSTFEENLATDVLEIITVFSARLYGSRSHKNKKLLDELTKISKEI